MPEIARFEGLIIRMYREVGSPHHRPHFHVYAGASQAVVFFDRIEIGAGEIDGRRARLLLAWAAFHHDELLRNWNRLSGGWPPLPIEPMR